MTRLHPLATLAAAVLLTTAAAAHHSISGTYAIDKRVHLEGRISSFNFRNPHSFVEIEVSGEAVDGHSVEPVRWSVEWVSGESLHKQGIQKTTLAVGDHVIILAQPSRDPAENRAHMMGIQRPSDGWNWGRKID